jgi:hypothetical protein
VATLTLIFHRWVWVLMVVPVVALGTIVVGRVLVVRVAGRLVAV